MSSDQRGGDPQRADAQAAAEVGEAVRGDLIRARDMTTNAQPAQPRGGVAETAVQFADIDPFVGELVGDGGTAQRVTGDRPAFRQGELFDAGQRVGVDDDDATAVFGQQQLVLAEVKSPVGNSTLPPAIRMGPMGLMRLMRPPLVP